MSSLANQILVICVLVFCLWACQARRPYGQVQVGHTYPQGNCREVGQVIGNANTRDGAKEQSLTDLRYRAAQREATYVRLLAVAPYGMSARGIAYRCQ